MDRSFDWLGRFPLAVDLADTVRVRGSTEIDLLVDPEDLERWIAAEKSRFPIVEAARERLDEVRLIRDSVRTMLMARTEGRAFPKDAVSVINEALSRSPFHPVLDTDGTVGAVELNDDPFDIFCALVARSLIEVLGDDHDQSLAHCRAPSCGMFFIRSDTRQHWCSPACGNRARVERHSRSLRSQ